MHECEVWLLIDENGDYVASHDIDALSDLYDGEIGSDRETTGLRFVRMTVKMPAPAVIELAGEIPAEKTAGTLEVSERKDGAA